MKEIDSNIFIGSDDDYHTVSEDKDFVFIQAARDPFFTELNQPSGVLFARVDNRLVLNMVDAGPGFPFDPSLFTESIKFINDNKDKKVLIHCNQGQSRSPAIACLYLGVKYNLSYVEAVYKLNYRDYHPNGVERFLIKNWNKLKQLCR